MGLMVLALSLALVGSSGQQFARADDLRGVLCALVQAALGVALGLLALRMPA